MMKDTANAFLKSNPIIPSNVKAIETDTGIFKIGDGETNYNDLPIAGRDVADFSGSESIMASAMSGDIALRITPATLGSSAAAVAAAIAGDAEKFTRDVLVELVNTAGTVHTWFNGSLAVAGSETTAGDGTADTSEETVTMVDGVGTCTLEYIGVWAAADTATVTVTGGTILGYTVANKTSVDTLIA